MTQASLGQRVSLALRKAGRRKHNPDKRVPGFHLAPIRKDRVYVRYRGRGTVNGTDPRHMESLLSASVLLRAGFQVLLQSSGLALWVADDPDVLAGIAKPQPSYALPTKDGAPPHQGLTCDTILGCEFIEGSKPA